MSQKALWGWYKVGNYWVKVQVDNLGRLVLDPTLLFEDTPTEDEDEKAPTSEWAYDHNAAAISASVHGLITGASLSQTFGASSARLRNLIPTPVDGEILRIGNAQDSPFSGLINGVPTSTSVVYDGDTNEDMFDGLEAYDGTTRWGQIILHNTTRGNSRKIVSVDIATNTITTTASTDDWADNDVITCQSQTNLAGGYFDIDMSKKIASTVIAIILKASVWNRSADVTALRNLRLHPFEARDVGKEIEVYASIAGEVSVIQLLMPVLSQKFTARFILFTNHYIALAVQGYIEYADT